MFVYYLHSKSQFSFWNLKGSTTFLISSHLTKKAPELNLSEIWDAKLQYVLQMYKHFSREQHVVFELQTGPIWKS